MSDAITRTMIAAYEASAPPTMFLTEMFSGTEFYNSERFEYDEIRNSEKMVAPMPAMDTGYNFNKRKRFHNKDFAAPTYSEAIGINSFELLKRQYGDHPFQSIDFRANLTRHILSDVRKVDEMFRRSIEFQASQILQTGALSLVDSDGNVTFAESFGVKSSHFFTTANAWDTGSATIFDDIDTAAQLIRVDALMDPDELIMGEPSFAAFMADPQVVAELDNRRIDVGAIRPSMRGGGAVWKGRYHIRGYEYDIWTYNGRYDDIQTGTSTRFINDTTCLVRASRAQLTKTFGFLPHIGSMVGRQRLIPELPARMSMNGAGMDLFLNVWLDDSGDNLYAGVRTKPMLLPKAVHSWCRINTGV